MVGVDARPDLTEMVECHPVWNRTVARFVRNPMSKRHSIAHSDHPISVVTLCQLPEAAGCLVARRCLDGAHCHTAVMAGQKAKVLTLDAASSAISGAGDGGTSTTPALAKATESTLIRRERRIREIYARHYLFRRGPTQIHTLHATSDSQFVHARSPGPVKSRACRHAHLAASPSYRLTWATPP